MTRNKSSVKIIIAKKVMTVKTDPLPEIGKKHEIQISAAWFLTENS